MFSIWSGAKCDAKGVSSGRNRDGEEGAESGRTMAVSRVLPMLMSKRFEVGRLGKPEV